MWCFWIVVLEKTLESLLDFKEIKPVHPKGIQPWIFIGRTDAEAETPILWPLMQRTDSLEKPLMLGKIESQRWRGWQRMKWLDSTTYSVDMNLSTLWEIVKDRVAWCASVYGAAKSQTRLSDWTTAIDIYQLSLQISHQNHCIFSFQRIFAMSLIFFFTSSIS